MSLCLLLRSNQALLLLMSVRTYIVHSTCKHFLFFTHKWYYIIWYYNAIYSFIYLLVGCCRLLFYVHIISLFFIFSFFHFFFLSFLYPFMCIFLHFTQPILSIKRFIISWFYFLPLTTFPPLFSSSLILFQFLFIRFHNFLHLLNVLLFFSPLPSRPLSHCFISSSSFYHYHHLLTSSSSSFSSSPSSIYFHSYLFLLLSLLL